MSATFEQLIESIVERKLAEKLAELERKPTWITVEAYAADRSISTSTVYAAVKDGRLPANRFGETPKKKNGEKNDGRAIRVRADVEIGRPFRVERIGTDDASWAARVKTGGRR